MYSSEMAGLGTGGGGGLLAAQTGRHSELLYKQQELLTWLGIGVHAGTRSSKEAEAKVHLAFRNCVRVHGGGESARPLTRARTS